MNERIEAIREIIRADPLGRGYAAMSDEDIAQHVTANRLYTEHVPEVSLESVTKLLASRGKLFDLIQQAAAGNLKAAPIAWVIQSSGWTTVDLDDLSVRAALQMAADDPAIAADQADLDAVLALAEAAPVVTVTEVAPARRADDGTPLIEGHT